MRRIFLFSAFLIGARAWAQVATIASSQMLMPPPVSDAGYPAGGTDERTNYLNGGMTLSGGYINNLYPGYGSTSVNDSFYFVEPNISADHTTPRSHETFTYAPSFTFYDPNSALNTIDQSGAGAFQYRLSPHLNLLAGDTIAKTSDTWNQPLSSATVSGTLPSVTPGIIVPFAPQVSNSAYAQLGWQISRNGMAGFGGTTTLLNYSTTSEAQGLYNSTSRGGSGFYTRRLAEKQYLGGTYQYSSIVAKPATASGVAEADLDANNLLGFYTVYLKPTISLSLGAGAQYYRLTQAPMAALRGWTPSAVGSLGWQGLHSSFALSYSRLATEGAGIIGAYDTSSAAASVRSQLSRLWSIGLGGNYATMSSIAGSIAGSIPAGHTLSGTGSVSRQLGQQFSITVQYQRLNQSYAGIPAIKSDPNSSHESVMLAYHFSKPLGRE